MKRRSLILGAFVTGLFVFILFLTHTSESLGQRGACVNNLKQIGLALINYESTWQTFPSGTVPNPVLPPEKRLSWLVSILPFLEGGGPWFIDESKAWDEGENRLIKRGEKETDRVHVAEDLRLYRCAASHESLDSSGQGLSSCVAVAGLGADAPGLPVGNRRAGLFGYERTTKLDQITDGLSTTMAVIETSNENPKSSAAPRRLASALHIV